MARLQLNGAIFIDILGAIVGIVPMAYGFWRRFMDVNMRREELTFVLQELRSKINDMDQEAQNQERQHSCKKRKNVLNAFLSQVERYIDSAQFVLDRTQEGPWILTRISWVPSIERHHREGLQHLNKANRLIREGLTYTQIRTRGDILPLQEDQYMGESFCWNLKSGLEAIKDGNSQCIGIYGYTLAGKTTLMKHLHNKVCEDKQGFKAVFWCTGPELDPDHVDYGKELQKCVADAMGIDLDNSIVDDEVRNAQKIMARLNEISSSGNAVLFLDNVRGNFPSYDLLGLPSLTNTQGSDTDSMNCKLVFTTQSKNVCFKMKCDVTLKMDLLEEKEAQELFCHEAFRPDFTEERNIKQVAAKVAKQCARMPLAIIMIARSMARINDCREWRNRLNELMGTIASIHNDEEMIIKHMKFGYDCLKDKTLPLQRCFLDAAKLLDNDHQISRKGIIEKWKNRGIIGMDRGSELADDQGYSILNQLERMCLIQVEVSQDQEAMVSMNKWIRKMAAKVS